MPGGQPPQSLEETRLQAANCTRCPLYADATQVVFGEGPETARVMFVGEQPGDKEDLAGRPFVGPSGKLLDVELQAAGLNREECYITNAVKHFKYECIRPRCCGFPIPQRAPNSAAILKRLRRA